MGDHQNVERMIADGFVVDPHQAREDAARILAAEDVAEAHSALAALVRRHRSLGREEIEGVLRDHIDRSAVPPAWLPPRRLPLV
ncbi:hypothetical protein HYE82_15715 [Streptomyces sp. BR123]|uniref:hypothetical protein n=1 Tax=Streptomyces sp. BR123 TaxID=2749828 RepID=UPI0015C494FD|nr:hypothetical protein [Streptomyces sp. BR123]NXY95813.1 hypothetical protein [Streptomyces sp. BR123]